MQIYLLRSLFESIAIFILVLSLSMTDSQISYCLDGHVIHEANQVELVRFI